MSIKNNGESSWQQSKSVHKDHAIDQSFLKQSLFHLLHLCDPTLPIGGFSHSASLETYVQNGLVHDKESAKTFVHEMLSQSILYNDALFLSLTFDACQNNDWEEIKELDAYCHATKIPKEMRMASHKLGIRLFKIFRECSQHELLERLSSAIEKKEINGHYSIVFGIVSWILGIDKKSCLTGFYFNAATGFVTNSVKLIPLGQLDGQKILFESASLIESLVEQSMSPNRDLMGLCSVGFDIRSMQHENLYSRLYMS